MRKLTATLTDNPGVDEQRVTVEEVCLLVGWLVA